VLPLNIFLVALSTLACPPVFLLPLHVAHQRRDPAADIGEEESLAVSMRRKQKQQLSLAYGWPSCALCF
jgi:hypothetical protein